jgi:serine/threonine-protein kinase
LLIGALIIAGLGAVAIGLSPAVREKISEFSWRQNVPAEKLLAVIPFHAIETDGASIALCDGMAEILTSKLTQLEQFHGSLRVISSNEVLRERLSSTREARARFGATLAITGSFQRANGNVILTTNLVDTLNQLTLAARTIEGSARDMAQLEQSLLQKVAEMLQLQLQPEARRVLAQIQPSTAPGAYEFYLQGRGYLQRRDRVENLENAILVFDRALAQDPNYALAYAGRAEAYWRRYDNTKDPQFLDSARSSCLTAVRLNDRLAPVHITMGLVQMSGGQYGEAIQSFQKAVAIDTVNAEAVRELANAYDKSGRLKEAEANFRRAIELRPNDWAGYRDLGAFLDVHGKREEAVQAFERAIQLTPDNYSAYRSLGGLYMKLERLDDAAAMLKKSLDIKPFDRTYSNLGTIYYFQKRYQEAADMYRKAVDMTPTDSALWGNLADAYRWIPDLEHAREAYRHAIELGERQLEINPKDSQLRSKVAMYDAAIGENDKAVRHASRAVAEAPKIGFVQYRAALVYEGSKMRGHALKALEAALDAGYPLVEIRAEPSLAELRKDPRFRVLEQKQASKIGRTN